MVESRSKIVDSIADAQGYVGWELANAVECHAVAKSFRVSLNRERAEIRLLEGVDNGFQFIDVAVGPFNL
jgi:hypothetical protein